MSYQDNSSTSWYSSLHYLDQNFQSALSLYISDGFMFYDPEKDKQPLRGQGSALEMRPGMFCALFPSDAHSACRHTEGQPPAAYVKYVVKLEA